MTRTIAVTYVRMGSERLPGKMLREIAGKPMLEHLIDRMRLVPHIDGMVIATSVDPANDPIAALCNRLKIPCFRGSETDVLGRVLGALESQHAETGVIAYGDGPLMDPALMTECLDALNADPSLQLAGNDMKATYPSGMYAEAFKVSALRDAAERTNDPVMHEHATLFLRQHPELYKTVNIEATGKLRRPDIHLDVDTGEDFRVVTAVIEHFAPRNDFTLGEILAFIDAYPDIARLNQNVHRRWKQFQRK
ncbi:MAG: glycosyltransferase family protein [Candidatus Peribacteraceae bacterium]|nr:glycosyltransferase family protein [Candidatus Peribacteraceae bacterium]MDD5074790.1 glycosyltransferase family protein [Candidatus Peribacteraceae bacterium]